MTDCEWCGMTIREAERHKDCKERAKNPESGMPDPECDHEDKEYKGSQEGRDGLGQPVSVLEYRCKKCGGVFAE